MRTAWYPGPGVRSHGAPTRPSGTSQGRRAACSHEPPTTTRSRSWPDRPARRSAARSASSSSSTGTSPPPTPWTAASAPSRPPWRSRAGAPATRSTSCAAAPARRPSRSCTSARRATRAPSAGPPRRLLARLQRAEPVERQHGRRDRRRLRPQHDVAERGDRHAGRPRRGVLLGREPALGADQQRQRAAGALQGGVERPVRILVREQHRARREGVRGGRCRRRCAGRAGAWPARRPRPRCAASGRCASRAA